MTKLDNYAKLFIVWAFLFQIKLIIHFARRKPFFESYTVKYGWVVYALCIPAVVISLILLLGGKSWSFRLGGFLFLLFAAFGYWVDYVAQSPFRNPLQWSIVLPNAFLYLATVTFHGWPLRSLSRPLWIAHAVLFAVPTVLNSTTHQEGGSYGRKNKSHTVA